MTQNNPFNPHEHMMQLKSREGSKDYLPVQWRIVWFRELCPDGTIDTEEMQVDLDREMTVEAFVWNAEKRKSEKVLKSATGYARFKAVVTDGKGGRATGTKSECAADFADYVEKAETGAIGRALAALGYGTQFAPEFNEEHRIVDSPVEREAQAPRPIAAAKPQAVPVPAQAPLQASGAPTLATTQQVESIRKLCFALEKSAPTNQMSQEEAGELLGQLSAELRNRRKAS
jgi:hypothetical protein